MNVIRGFELPIHPPFFDVDGVQNPRHGSHIQNSGAQHGCGTDRAPHTDVPAHMVGCLGGPNSLPSGSRVVLQQRRPVVFNR